METMKRTAELDRLSFTILAIEASAKKLGITPAEMRRRLERAGLIKNFIVDCYDTLHTESREAVANDVVEALKNWERRRNGQINSLPRIDCRGRKANCQHWQKGLGFWSGILSY